MSAILSWLRSGTPPHYVYIVGAVVLLVEYALPRVQRPEARSLLELLLNGLRLIPGVGAFVSRFGSPVKAPLTAEPPRIADIAKPAVFLLAFLAPGVVLALPVPGIVLSPGAVEEKHIHDGDVRSYNPCELGPVRWLDRACAHQMLAQGDPQSTHASPPTPADRPSAAHTAELPSQTPPTPLVQPVPVPQPAAVPPDAVDPTKPICTEKTTAATSAPTTTLGKIERVLYIVGAVAALGAVTAEKFDAIISGHPSTTP